MSRRKNLKAFLAGGTCALALASAGMAAAQTRDYDVPPGELMAALDAYARQSGMQIIYKIADVSGVKSGGAQGALSDDEALNRLLEGTNFEVRRDPSGAIAIAMEGRRGPQFASAAAEDADGTVEALIVTAQKREEDIQDVPIAISAFTQEDLTRSQIAGGPDLMTQVPNFTFTKTNFSGYSIQIRGIGTQAISATTDPAVAVAFNNTPFIRNRFFEQEFYDLQRVEVLRGPQGTLYGRNATAGVVNIISGKPKFFYEAKASGQVGNFSTSRIEGMVNIPLVEDTVALRLAGAWTKRDGYVENSLAGEQTDGRDLWSSRVSLRAQPTDWLDVNLIWEHFEENDDRLRTGKQLCHSDPGPSEVAGEVVEQSAAAIQSNLTTLYVSQGCRPASLYSPDSFDTPNGYALAYYAALALVGSPTYLNYNPYANSFQSHDLRAIETHLKPEYEAKTDVLELQVNVDLPGNLSFSSETGYLRDFIFSFSDFNRFDTTPGVFVPGAPGHVALPELHPGDYPNLDIVDMDGYFCDPQLGCTTRLAAGDLSTARSRQFAQEFRLSSDYDGPFNFNLGVNFLRYDTEEKYYVFINTLTAYQAWIGKVELDRMGIDAPWVPGVSDNGHCFTENFYGPVISDPNTYYNGIACAYIDPNDIHNLNDQGRNYFLSKNPYHLMSYAAFGEAYYNITPDLKFTAGLRWTVDRKTAPVIPSWLLAGGGSNDDVGSGSYGLPVRKVIDQEWEEPTGRVAIDWKPDLSFTDETLVYGSYVRGYKAGGANPPPPVVVFATTCPPHCVNTEEEIIASFLAHPETFEAEYIDAYELGTKNTFADGRVTVNIAGFYYDYTGYQISQIVNRSAVNQNFDAQIWGAEVELDWRPLENLRLALKGGYEQTRMADGSRAIDLMDRTAGKEGWIIFRPFPTMPSNCVVTEEVAALAAGSGLCAAYIVGLDPVTYEPYVPNPDQDSGPAGPIPDDYPGFNPTQANNGEGFFKDLSGNELPNAPDFTLTLSADYTLPFPDDWLMTLHTDLYYQSEAWWRVFNTPGYDKLKAYTNVNLAAIFTNEDAGWNIMAYVKNVLDKDNITGAFLNSDDTGLTTNVFLNEPRLYGIRVTKNWEGGPLLGGFGARRDGPYPFTVEIGAQMQRQDTPTRALIPFPEGLLSGSADPYRLQSEDLDWTHGPQLRMTYQVEGSPWKIIGGVRYGKTGNQTGRVRAAEAMGEAVCIYPAKPFYHPALPGVDLSFRGKLACDPEYGPVTVTLFGNAITFENAYDPANVLRHTDRLSATTNREEDHVIVDFAVGREVGLGLSGVTSSLGGGIRIAEFKSSTSGEMRAIANMDPPHDAWLKYETSFDQYAATFDGQREFKGVGPVLSWEASRSLWGREDFGQLQLDWTVTGGALFGKQKARVEATQGSDHFQGYYPAHPDNWAVNAMPAPDQTPIDIAPRNNSATVPLLDLSLGLSFKSPGVTLSTGYRWERYFGVIDGGFVEHKSYDRTIDGPYFRVSVGLGGR